MFTRLNWLALFAILLVPATLQTDASDRSELAGSVAAERPALTR